MLHASDESLAISQGYAENKGIESNILTPHNIAYYVLYTYATLMRKRKSEGITVSTMSRQEYQDNKPEKFPDYWILSNVAGGWNNISGILPINDSDRDTRNRRGDDASIEKFYHVLVLVAADKGVAPMDVSVKNFSDFKAKNPQLDIANWKVYAQYIIGEEKWSEAKSVAVSTIGKRRMLDGD